jgi:DNA-binding NtrC family response regulator
MIERASLIAAGPEITMQDLGIIEDHSVHEGRPPPDPCVPDIPPAGIDLPTLLATIEKRYIEEALGLTGANETKAAKLLNYKYSTLRYRRRILNIS